MTRAWRILVVDDDPAIGRALGRGLSLAGFVVELASGGQQALDLVASAAPDAVVLDVSMPDISGIEVCRRLRAAGCDLPVLMLSALDEVDDRVAGLAAGADDYVVKPFAIAEVELRLAALVRRVGAAPHGVHVVGGLAVDTDARRVTLDGTTIEVTRREFDVLELLARNAGIVLGRSQVLERVWGYDFDVRTDAVDTIISYLRRKLEADGRRRILHTVRGTGFVLRDDGNW
ncbi:response regulator transcription factor [Longispora sp. K20-0274]|uniref:response regulator transcription factor n=1 Tax=Longispora sp. K20-0274 TaxID=3088255 RepID=UPI00399AF193